MKESTTRRMMLVRTASWSCGLITVPGAVSLMAQTPQPLPSPNAPTNPNAPAGLNGPEIIHPDKPPQPNPQNAQAINAAVQEIYARALELKNEADRTNLNATLPLDFVKKAERIEKLAKFVKDRVKG